MTPEGTLSHPAGAREPRWPAALALFSVGALNLSLPESLTVGPDWLLLALVLGLTILGALFGRRGWPRASRKIGFLAHGVVTADLLVSMFLLVRSLPSHAVAPKALLGAAAALWLANILVFAGWYWRLDAGGPHARESRARHTHGDFLFPQMTIDPATSPLGGDPDWSPGFVDYLFLAFNTSTAFSPTDVPVLSPWAKLLMMLQASISFTTVALLAARAVNIL